MAVARCPARRRRSSCRREARASCAPAAAAATAADASRSRATDTISSSSLSPSPHQSGGAWSTEASATNRTIHRHKSHTPRVTRRGASPTAVAVAQAVGGGAAAAAVLRWQMRPLLVASPQRRFDGCAAPPPARVARQKTRTRRGRGGPSRAAAPRAAAAAAQPRRRHSRAASRPPYSFSESLPHSSSRVPQYHAMSSFPFDDRPALALPLTVFVVRSRWSMSACCSSAARFLHRPLFSRPRRLLFAARLFMRPPVQRLIFQAAVHHGTTAGAPRKLLDRLLRHGA